MRKPDCDTMAVFKGWPFPRGGRFQGWLFSRGGCFQAVSALRGSTVLTQLIFRRFRLITCGQYHKFFNIVANEKINSDLSPVWVTQAKRNMKKDWKEPHYS